MNQKDFKNKSEMQIFLSYFRPHRKLFLLDMVCALAIAVIDLAFPFISRWCMYKLLPDNAWRTFWTVMVVVFCAYILRSVFKFIITRHIPMEELRNQRQILLDMRKQMN